MKSQNNLLYSTDIKSKALTYFRKHVTLVILSGTAMILFIWWAYANFMPKSLGDKFEYLGKTDYGCYFICDSEPGSGYYFGTDMTPEEVVNHFKKAELEFPIESNFEYVYIRLINKESSGVMTLYYRENDSDFLAERKLKSTNKKHILEMESTSYEIAKKSL